MITVSEREEIIKVGQLDGQRLFNVAEAIYKGLIILNWVVGVLGIISGIVIIAQAGNAGASAFFIGVGVLIATAIICVIQYAAAVLTTHGAKVLVHLLFSNLAIMNQEGK